MLQGPRWLSLWKIPSGLLGMLLLIGMLERQVSRYPELILSSHEMDWAVGVRDSENNCRGEDILCFGDSMLKFGLSPILLAERLGCSVRSVALLDGNPASSYFLFRRAILAGAKPKIVFVDYQPECLYQEAERLASRAQWRALLSLSECWELAKEFHDPSFFTRTVAQIAVPSFGGRIELRSGLLHSLQGKPCPNIEENAKLARNRVVNLGGLILPEQPQFNGEIPADYFDKVMFPAHWMNRPEHTVFVERFMRLAAEHGIRVYWVLPPNAPKLQKIRDDIGLTARYDSFVRSVQERYSNLSVIEARHSGFERDVFVDPVHLNRQGAWKLSAAVAEVVRGTNPQRREIVHSNWIKLQPGLTPPPTVYLEDIEQSKSKLGSRDVAADVRVWSGKNLK